MSIIDYSQQRLESILDLISKLKDSDFPYRHSRDALEVVENIFISLKTDLYNATKGQDQELIRGICSRIIDEVFTYLPVVGIILRSTNVRNAFEIHGPLYRLSKGILNSNTKLLISSEWEYSPFNYRPIPNMDSYVIIGLPSTDSANPLVFPLAGHELGHSIWARIDLENALVEIARQAIIDEVKLNRWGKFRELFAGISDKPDEFGNSIFDLPSIAPAVAWAGRQFEETFCDFIGLKIFGSSYLHAFAYLLAPGIAGRAPYYPGLNTRFINLAKASDKYNLEKPANFANLATPDIIPLDWTEADKLLVSLADFALQKVVDDLINITEAYINQSKIETPNNDIIKEIICHFEKAVPSHGHKGLANILNAGWDLYLRADLWNNIDNISDKRICLKEIILKSIEILEVEERIGR